uniref:Uncharacterized protein n=1 Tax=Anguilla anguilla TaxID=7936 RepID=A0A0E9XQ70_ANGAN
MVCFMIVSLINFYFFLGISFLFRDFFVGGVGGSNRGLVINEDSHTWVAFYLGLVFKMIVIYLLIF